MLDGGRAVEYIEATLADISAANRIAHEVLGRSLDELPPQTRRLLAATVEYVREQMKAQAIPQADVRFTRKQLRAHTGSSDTQLRVHLQRLHELEYLIAHCGMRGQSYAYELAFDGQADADAPHLAGLIDVAAIEAATTTASSRGAALEFAPPSRGQNGPVSAPSQTALSAAAPVLTRLAAQGLDEGAQTHVLPRNGNAASYVLPSTHTGIELACARP